MTRWAGACRRCGRGIVREGRRPIRWPWPLSFFAARDCFAMLPTLPYGVTAFCSGRVRVLRDQEVALIAYALGGPDALRDMP